METRSGAYYRVRRNAWRLSLYALAFGLSFAFLFPVVWAFGASFKPLIEVYRFPPTFFTWPPRWQNYPEALSKLPFAAFIWNTFVITISSTVGQILSASLVGYAFARLNWKGREFWFLCLLATMMLPGQVLLIPHYLIFKNLGWVNTYKPLIVPSWLGGGAFFIFLFRQFFKGIPQELSDAAKIDGASELRIYAYIFLPLAKPIVITVGIMSFIGHWKQFMGPLIYLSDYETYPVALGLRMYQQVEGGSFIHYLMAASVVALFPLLILFFLSQRYITKGLLLTGSKG
ncbi:MAG TPA: carbohydrate ABC transporter permease [Candidatus Brocadiia bacterium]|nr:carbohydrate ABC transporter permease [Candidatus Brocadiia bacterium]